MTKSSPLGFILENLLKIKSKYNQHWNSMSINDGLVLMIFLVDRFLTIMGQTELPLKEPSIKFRMSPLEANANKTLVTGMQEVEDGQRQQGVVPGGAQPGGQQLADDHGHQGNGEEREEREEQQPLTGECGGPGQAVAERQQHGQRGVPGEPDVPEGVPGDVSGDVPEGPCVPKDTGAPVEHQGDGGVEGSGVPGDVNGEPGMPGHQGDGHGVQEQPNSEFEQGNKLCERHRQPDVIPVQGKESGKPVGWLLRLDGTENEREMLLKAESKDTSPVHKDGIQGVQASTSNEPGPQLLSRKNWDLINKQVHMIECGNNSLLHKALMNPPVCQLSQQFNDLELPIIGVPMTYQYFQKRIGGDLLAFHNSCLEISRPLLTNLLKVSSNKDTLYFNLTYSDA